MATIVLSKVGFLRIAGDDLDFFQLLLHAGFDRRHEVARS